MIKEVLNVFYLTSFVTPLIIISINLWSTKSNIEKIEEYNRQNQISTVTLNSDSTDLANKILQTETLIPLLIGGVIVVSLLIILFTFCTDERSKAIIGIISSIRGKKEEKDEKVNVTVNGMKKKKKKSNKNKEKQKKQEKKQEKNDTKRSTEENKQNNKDDKGNKKQKQEGNKKQKQEINEIKKEDKNNSENKQSSRKTETDISKIDEIV
tara:strand:- start:25 stop:654 length:630 start_codon:yes stop_codon:yes gene_type:complete